MTVKVKKEMSFLRKELERYEKNTVMTDTEKIALREWVDGGNSVHENPSMGSYENGQPIDFLDDYRYHEEIRQTLRTMTPFEQEKYIARLQGRDTVDTLREDLYHKSLKADIYEKVLRKYNLLEEADQLLERAYEAIQLPELAADKELLFQ